jgi:large subunit ribosomal protein L9
VSQVKLILLESIHSLGEAGDLVRVKPGYARNYLLPQGKAILATDSRVEELEHNKRIAAEKAARELQNLQILKQKIESLEIEISARAGEEGRLFGSVTAAQIAERLVGHGYEIDRRRVILGEPIKEIGEHKVPVRLHSQLRAEIRVRVVAESGPTEPQEAGEAEEEREERRDRRRDRDTDEEGSAEDES